MRCKSENETQEVYSLFLIINSLFQKNTRTCFEGRYIATFHRIKKFVARYDDATVLRDETHKL